MNKNKYINIWLILVDIKAMKGYGLDDLTEKEEMKVSIKKLTAAWANILVKANNISEALQIIPLGLHEKGFEVLFIDKVENLKSLIENKELKDGLVEEADWLLKSKYVFKIFDPIYPHY